MDISGNIITAAPGYILVRVADGQRFSPSLALGLTYWLDGCKLDTPLRELPGHYTEEPMTDGELRDNVDRPRVLSAVNAVTDRRILCGLRWRGHDVWLSVENQFNYKAAYDIAVQTWGATLPVTFKFGRDNAPDYYEFSELADLHDFYSASLGHVTSCLDSGWKAKSAALSADWDTVAAWLGMSPADFIRAYQRTC